MSQLCLLPRQQWNEIKWKPEVSCFSDISPQGLSTLSHVLEVELLRSTKMYKSAIRSSQRSQYELKNSHQIIYAAVHFYFTVNRDLVNFERVSRGRAAFAPMLWSLLHCVMSFSCLRCCLTGLRLLARGESGWTRTGCGCSFLSIINFDVSHFKSIRTHSPPCATEGHASPSLFDLDITLGFTFKVITFECF